MSLITTELDADDIENWFQIGKDASQKKMPAVLAKSTLGGHVFDSKTCTAYERDETEEYNSRVPKYLRNNFVGDRQQYLDEYEQTTNNLAALSNQRKLEEEAAASISGQLEGLELDSTILGGSVAVPDDLIPEGATEVYKHYKFHHKYADLPTFKAYEMIISTVESNQVTVIQGPTGSGKTTQVPQYILDHYAQESKYCNIVVTQPRKIAASSIARRVCDERGWDLGSLCGYQHGLVQETSEDTRLLYCTTGVLKEKLIRRKNMHEFTHIILDEVHERDIETDFALLIVKKLLRTNSPHVKVILMSATFNTEEFAQYFSLPVGWCLEPAPVITVGTSHHHISEFFADDLTSRLGEVPPLNESEPGISPAMYDMAIALIKEFDLLEEKEYGRDERTGVVNVRGTVLIFLPGLQEIISMANRVRRLEDTHFLQPIPLHSTITIEEQNKVFKKPTRGFRKVILSTNIAESSITVPDIKYVIDFCLTRSLCCDPETNYTKLQLEWASKANAKQRKGRAGRVSNGRVYYMVPRYFYEKVLPEYGTPEMQRCPLENLVLKTKIFDMGEPKALLGLALSPPDLNDIGRTILQLKEVGALTTEIGQKANPFDGTLTFVGRVLANLPVDIRVGKMLVLAHVFGMLEEALIIGAAMSVKSIFANPLQAKLEAYKAKLNWSDSYLSDSIAVLTAYKVWDNRMKTKEFARAGATEKEWGLKHFIQRNRMKEVKDVMMELEQRLKAFNIVLPRQRKKDTYTSATERLILKLILCGGFYPNYAVKEETDEVDAVRQLSNCDPLRTVVLRGLPMNQGILYEKEIKRIFSSCWKDPPPCISAEQSRVFVEFVWKAGTTSESRVHPGVLIAIKLRQLGIPLSVNQLDREETNRRLTELRKATSSQRAAGDLRTTRLRGETEEGKDQNASSYIDTNPQLSMFLVNVTEVIECGHFWGQCEDLRTSKYLSQINSSLNNPARPLMPLSCAASPGMLVAAPYFDITEHYYRARVEEIKPAGGMMKTEVNALVFFVDFGNTELVPVARLRTLAPDCHNLPFLAAEFYLRGIRPSNLRCADGVWSKQATTFFRSWTLNKTLLAQVYSVVNNTVRVDLVAKFPNGQELCFNEELLVQEFADKSEESYLSQQNHEWRVSQMKGESSGVRPDSWVQVNISEDQHKKQDKRRTKKQVTLVGPTNPLEMVFSCLTFSGRQRAIKIDPDSVNSVAIDDDPQNKYSRLMVASYIGMNAGGNSIVARETTIMPQIPGLPALVTLLFAPYTEYRTDAKCSRYTGALCGLGCDDEGLPVLPDHDIELVFETKFDTNDVAMINDVRMAINVALGTEDNMSGWGPDILANIQEKAREKLLALLKRQREPVEQVCVNRMYVWNQLDPATILHHNLHHTEADVPHLLRLHNAVCLVETGEDMLATTTASRASKTQYYLNHLRELDKIAESHGRKPVRCELCAVTLPNSHILAIHLQTQSHLQKVTQVEEGSLK